VKIVAPSPLLREAADMLEDVRDHLVVIGAAAVQVTLDGQQTALTPTRDVDVGIAGEDAERIVAHLQAHGMRRSGLPHERSFTWVKDELKVQLVRSFHPFPKGVTSGLPVNNLLGELATYRIRVAFRNEPQRGRLWVASPAALVALKGEAFGRTRITGETVERDYSDAALLLDRLGLEIAAELSVPSPMRQRVHGTARRLLDDDARAAAAREILRTGQEQSRQAAEAAVTRAAQRMLRRLAR
jgi:hypothetical protein